MPSESERLPRRIVSGGQTGVDRGALDAALGLGLPHGGWVPRGRKAEDGVLPERYELREADSPDYAHRTRLNVEDSDGTLVLTVGPASGGTAATIRHAVKVGKPYLVLDLDDDPDPESARAWIEAEGIGVMNVAGPRESKAPGVRERAEEFVRRLLQVP